MVFNYGVGVVFNVNVHTGVIYCFGSPAPYRKPRSGYRGKLVSNAWGLPFMPKPSPHTIYRLRKKALHTLQAEILITMCETINIRRAGQNKNEHIIVNPLTN
jgi:hypothetical protein